jgi:hypothetical protein
MKPLLMRDQMFVGWAVPGTRHNKVFNGSMWMFTAGDELQWMWDTFKPDQSPQRALQAGFYGSIKVTSRISWCTRSCAVTGRRKMAF